MLRITLASLRGHLRRLLSTSLAVLIGVAFLAGTLVLTDTIERTFNALFADVNAGTDAYVRRVADFRSDFGARPRVETALIATVAAVDGVRTAEGTLQGYTQIVGADGEALGNPGQGAPTFGGNWQRDPALNPFRLVEGRAPRAANEVVIDKRSADLGKLDVGDRTRVLALGPPYDVTVVGIARFGAADSPLGASYALFTDEVAQRLTGEPGRYDAVVAVADESVSEKELQRRISAVTPAGVEVLTGADITAEDQNEVAGFLTFFSAFLLTFAGIALFVSCFIIYNTFSILVAQRTREMALLRALGATQRQVLWSLIAESAVVGLVASVLGLLAGIGVSSLLKGLLAALGIDIPAGGTVVTRSTVVVSLVTGLVVTMVSAYLPARRGARVAPIAALRDLSVEGAAGSRRRVVLGTVLTAIGASLLIAGLAAVSDRPVVLVGIGAAAIFLGVAVLGPVIARPVSRVLGAPLPRIQGVAGTLARENAMRNPRRTAATASALMIGVALVGFITIFASSIKASITDSIDKAFRGDFVADSALFGFGGLSPDFAARLNNIPEVAVATGLRLGFVQVDGADSALLAIDPKTYPQVVDLEVAKGSLAELGTDGVAVSESKAKDEGLAIGDPLRLTFAESGPADFVVRAIYAAGDVTAPADHVVSIAAYALRVPAQFDLQVFINIADGVRVDIARAAIERVLADFPNAELQDQTEFKEAQGAQINQILNLIYALLGLAVIIALLGIANTLSLSVFERTRELGLLRAVGMTRRQVRRTVRGESVIIALLGTALGLAIGLFFGWALVQALREDGLTTFRVPVGQLALVTVIAALAGVVAAVRPARRAARLDVLAAIATE
ncbi:MAG TPA: FtsX-like permease family protein [Mycobacteriales bacterium]|nr:FtsX-like permease family protein [Mycobacteriales bacterium]